MSQIPELLEAAMLICFGLSWPISLIKNIRARSARHMSLQFILLICVGYIAGIAAKLLRGAVSYVLIAYLINFIIVAANIAVYFLNRRLDRRAEIQSIEKAGGSTCCSNSVK